MLINLHTLHIWGIALHRQVTTAYSMADESNMYVNSMFEDYQSSGWNTLENDNHWRLLSAGWGSNVQEALKSLLKNYLRHLQIK